MKTEELIGRLKSGERRALAKAITLIEGARPDQRDLAQEVLQSVGVVRNSSFRIGITGAPGVGKSTFIEKLGMHLLSLGHRVAVLAVDPSSSLSGGSILGDKTRMPELAADNRAFIRPSPSSGALGGVNRRTHETLLLCEAAGYDVILIETVGVGQSEVTVTEMVDCLVLLALPHAGDEVQAIKKGVMEVLDLLVVHKCDGSLVESAQQTVREFRNALQLARHKVPSWTPPVLTASSLHGLGIDEVWQQVLAFQKTVKSNGWFQQQRLTQNEAWFQHAFQDEVLDLLQRHPGIQQSIIEACKAVRRGTVAPFTAARELAATILGGVP